MNKKTIDIEEIKKFSSLAEKWWDPLGEFKTLHDINPLRIKFIKNHIQQYYQISTDPIFQSLEFLDVGCGGGILSEPLAALGGNLTSIDPGEENIQIAKLHATQRDLNIDYRVATIEELSTEDTQFDILLNMEVLEHVADIKLFLEKSCHLLKAGGLMFLSTLNRTIKSYLLAIIAAEYILNWVPKKTHQWQKFIHPHELERILRDNSMKTIEYKGFKLNLLKQEWELTDRLDVNYMVVAEKC